MHRLICCALVVALTGCTSGSTPRATNEPLPSPKSTAAPVIVAAVGDMSCPVSDPSFRGGRGTDTLCRDGDVSDLVVKGDYDAFLSLGDQQYLNGELADFRRAYDLSFGRVKSTTYPVPGNHEYSLDRRARGYFAYFGPRARPPGYYSFDLGSWHVIALNTNCAFVEGKLGDNDCADGSPQERWLRKDLAANEAKCTLAFWHHPRFTSSNEKEVTDTPSTYHEAFWKDLYRAGADVIVNAHAHHYERLAPQTPDGKLDRTKGIHQFIVGGGGKDVDDFGEIYRNSAAHAQAFGILRLELGEGSFKWRFVPIKGQPTEDFRDEGSAACH
jgi:acid phosphatase type 7